MLCDTFWEDFKYQFMKNSMNVLATHLDEGEQNQLDLQDRQRVYRRRFKEAKAKSK